jgi:hypothetical protein
MENIKKNDTWKMYHSHKVEKIILSMISVFILLKVINSCCCYADK